MMTKLTASRTTWGYSLFLVDQDLTELDSAAATLQQDYDLNTLAGGMIETTQI